MTWRGDLWIPLIQLELLLGLAQLQSLPVFQAQTPQLSRSMLFNFSSQIMQAVGCKTEGSLEACQNFPKAVESSRLVEGSTLPPTNLELCECAHKLFQALCQHTGCVPQPILSALHPDKWEIPSLHCSSAISL